MATKQACSSREDKKWQVWLQTEARKKIQEIEATLLGLSPEKAKLIAAYYLARTNLMAGRDKEFCFASKQTARLAFGYPSGQRFRSALWALKNAWAGMIHVSAHENGAYKIKFHIVCFPTTHPKGVGHEQTRLDN